MANQQFTVASGDVTGTAFTVPGDNPGTSESFEVQPETLANSREWYIHIQNGFNENIDVVVQGSHYLDESMDAPVDDGASETISAGENGSFDGETGHTYIQINVTPAADPTSGDLTVTFQSRGD